MRCLVAFGGSAGFTSAFRQANLRVCRECIGVVLPARYQRAAPAAGRRTGGDLVAWKSPAFLELNTGARFRSRRCCRSSAEAGEGAQPSRTALCWHPVMQQHLAQTL